MFLPVGIGLGAVAPFAGKKSDTLGPRLLTTAGMLAGAIGALLLAWQASLLLWPALVLGMLGLGIGSGLFSAPNTNAVLSSMPEAALAVAGSMLSAARTLGVIVGVSISSRIYDVLRADQGANDAARAVFAGAAVCYAAVAALCWITRSAAADARVLLADRGLEAAPSGSRAGARGV